MPTQINLHLKNNDHTRIMRKIQFRSSFKEFVGFYVVTCLQVSERF